MKHDKREGLDIWVGRALLILAVFALCWQARSLYIYPIPDSVNYWYGDESWVMLEARTQASEGVLRHPYAYGATLNDHAGVLIGNSWSASLLYGLPAMIFAESFPAIAIGRTVSFALALISVFAIYFVALRLGATKTASGFASILLATAPAFTIASHSARTDLLVGLVVMLAAVYFSHEVSGSRVRSARWWFGFGLAMTISAFFFAIHLITLLLPLAVYLLFRLGVFRNMRLLLSTACGVVLAAIVLVGSYYLFTHNLSLFGTSGQHVQFVDVAAQKPIVRLFSRSVQWNNLLQRLALLWNGAPALLVLLGLVFPKVVIDLVRRRAEYLKVSMVRALLLLTMIVGGSWLLLQGSISYYVPHFLVLATVAIAELADRSEMRAQSSIVMRGCIVAAAVVLVVLHASQTESTLAASHLFSEENHRAISKLETRIHVDAGNKHPVVLAESPAAYGLELDTSIALMSPLFPAFPKVEESIHATLARYHVRYAMLYDAKELHDNIAGIPKLTEYIESHGTLLDTAIGIMFDMKRSYEHPDLSVPDTMKLYRLDEH